MIQNPAYRNSAFFFPNKHKRAAIININEQQASYTRKPDNEKTNTTHNTLLKNWNMACEA